MLNAARAILAARMATWTTAPICWPNTPPLTSLNVPWVRFSVLAGGDMTDYLTPGGPKAASGYVAVQCFAPAGSGDGTLSGYVDSIAALFRAYQSGKLICEKADVRTVGEADGWYQINIVVPWTITE